MKRIRLTFVAVCAVGAAVNSIAQYNPFYIDERAPDTRSRRADLYLLGQYWHAESATARDVTVPTAPGTNALMATGDVKFEFEDTGTVGFGLGYHLNNHFLLNAEFTFGFPDYDITFNGSHLSGEAFIHSGTFN